MPARVMNMYALSRVFSHTRVLSFALSRSVSLYVCPWMYRSGGGEEFVAGFRVIESTRDGGCGRGRCCVCSRCAIARIAARPHPSVR